MGKEGLSIRKNAEALALKLREERDGEAGLVIKQLASF